jgi:alpha-1,6-mannosyltransferase
MNAFVESPRTSGERSRLYTLCGLGAALIAVTAVAPHVTDPKNWQQFFSSIVVAMLLSGAIALAATRVAVPLRSGSALVVIVIVGAIIRVIAILPDPLLSSDIYRYVWDGRVQAAGINPYRYIPADPALAALRDAAIYPLINRADYAPTAYPPVAQFFFLLATRVAESVLAMRLALIGCEVITVLLMLDILRRLNRSPAWIVAYLWHPLAVWEIANGGHIDGLLAMLIVVAVWLLIRGWNVLGAGAAALAIMVKPYAAIMLAAFWKPWDWRAPAFVLATIALGYLPYLGVGWGVLGFIPGYLQEEGLRAGASFWLVRMVALMIGDHAFLRVVYFGLALAVLGILSFRVAFRSATAEPQRQIRNVALLLMAGLFFLSPNYPWYYLILVPLIPLGAGAPAWVLTLGGITLHLFWPENYDLRINIWKSMISIGFLIALYLDCRTPARHSNPETRMSQSQRA